MTVVGLREVFWRDRAPPSPDPPPVGWQPRLVRWSRAARRPSGVATIAIAALLLVSAAPFATASVYQTRGPNADTFALPPSFGELGAFFGTPPGGADYYVLVLPMSAQNGVYVDLGGHQFLDTSNLLATFVPYPVLETNNGPTAAAVEELLATGVPRDLAAVLANLHVRYVVDDPYENRTPMTMNEAPNGASIDYDAVLAALPGALGAPAHVGTFSVFSVPSAIPLGWSTSELVGIDSVSDADALALIGGVTSGPPGWSNALAGALWAPNGTLPGWELRPRPVAAPTANLSVPAGDSATAVNASGRWAPVPCATGTCAENGTEFTWTGATLSVEGPVERTTTRTGDYRTNGPPSSEGYCEPSGDEVDLPDDSAGLRPGVPHRDHLPGRSGREQLGERGTHLGKPHPAAPGVRASGPGPGDIGLSAAENGTSFAWHNVDLPAHLTNGTPWTMTLEWNASSAYGELAAGNASATTWLLFGNSGQDAVDPGSALADAPPGPVALTTANESIVLQGGAFCLQSASAVAPAGVSFLVDTGPGAPTGPTVGTTSSVSATGDVSVQASGEFVVLGYPYDPLWTSAANSGATTTEVDGAPLANVVELSSPGETVTFHFRTAILDGLYASFVEAAALVAAVVFLTLRRRRAAGRSGPPTSTPDSRTRAPSPDPTRWR